MPRRSSSSGSSRSAFRPRPVAASRPPPQTVNRAPPPAKAQPSGGGGGSILGNIGATITDGLAFGTGSSIAHRAVDAVMGPRTIKVETIDSQAVSADSSVAKTMTSCDIHSKAFQDCVNHFGSEISKCQSYMDMLNECKKKSSGSMMAA